MQNKGGIYKITNIINGKFYIGSSVNLNRRKSRHFEDFRKNIHSNPHFQNAYNKYGEENFIFEVIEYVEDKTMLIEREQHWLDYYKPFNEIGYNMVKNASSCLGVKRSEETRKKMSESKKGIPKSESTKEKMRQPRSEETKEKMRKPKANKNKNVENVEKVKPIKILKTKEEISEIQRGSNNPRAKLTEKDVIEIKRLIKNGVTNREIARKFNIGETTIAQIKTKKRWKHVEDDNSQDINLVNF